MMEPYDLTEHPAYPLTREGSTGSAVPAPEDPMPEESRAQTLDRIAA